LKQFLTEIIPNMTHYIVKFYVWRLSNMKKCGKSKWRVFLDVSSPPENKSKVCFPVKNLVQALLNLSCFAVQHCNMAHIMAATATSMRPIRPQSGDSFRDIGA
jgi:hypothetical protein